MKSNLYYLEVDGLAGAPITYAKPDDAIEDAQHIAKNNRGALIRLLGKDYDYVFRDGAFVALTRLDQRIVTMLRRILGANADGHLSIDECMTIRLAMAELSEGRGTLERVADSLSDLSAWMRSNTGPSDGTMDMLIKAEKAMSEASALLGVRR